jgi:hypothetical protein
MIPTYSLPPYVTTLINGKSFSIFFNNIVLDKYSYAVNT